MGGAKVSVFSKDSSSHRDRVSVLSPTKLGNKKVIL